MSHGAAERYLRFALLATVVAAALAAAAVPLTRAASVSDGAVPAALAGLAVAWLAALAGGLPLLRAGRAGGGPPAAMIVAALAAMGLRLAVVAAGATALALSGALPRAPLLLWTGVGYLALLAVETRYAVGETRTAEASAEVSAAAADAGGGDGRTTGRREAAPRRRATTTETR